MKPFSYTVAFVGNFSQTHCSEVHWAATLEDLGCTVIRLQENETTTEQVLEACSRSDFFMYVRTWDCLVTTELLYKISSMGIPTVSYHLDLYLPLRRRTGVLTDSFWRTDYVFSADGDPRSQEEFKKLGINHFPMLPAVYKAECYMATPQENPTRGNDVIFVGGGVTYGHDIEWPYRRELVTWLFDTYGDKYSKYGWPEESVRNADLNQLYADSKIAVGDSLCPGFTHESYTSDRLYESIGRGAFTVYPRIKGITDSFEDGKEIIYYDFGDFEDLKKKIDYYLVHDEEREKIRKAGWERCLRDHTYHNRLTQMLQTLEQEGAFKNVKH